MLKFTSLLFGQKKKKEKKEKETHFTALSSKDSNKGAPSIETDSNLA